MIQSNINCRSSIEILDWADADSCQNNDCHYIYALWFGHFGGSFRGRLVNKVHIFSGIYVLLWPSEFLCIHHVLCLLTNIIRCPQQL